LQHFEIRFYSPRIVVCVHARTGTVFRLVANRAGGTPLCRLIVVELARVIIGQVLLCALSFEPRFNTMSDTDVDVLIPLESNKINQRVSVSHSQLAGNETKDYSHTNCQIEFQ